MSGWVHGAKHEERTLLSLILKELRYGLEESELVVLVSHEVEDLDQHVEVRGRVWENLQQLH